MTLVPHVNYRWHGVASWTWDAQDETCGICRMAFDGCCPDCKLPGDDCPLIPLYLLIVVLAFEFDLAWIVKHIPVSGLGCLQPCISSPLHFEMGELTNSSSTLSHVPQGMAVQRINVSKCFSSFA
ncbi:hypothetical protein JRO89_XS12G0101900 [Xanthoceras sorbifolium]|uniref:Anaphase-promoting complex subunit 11 RING-H2 finger domain-containing protein n=1 Tax=Xanthoceras sorbifolium TaxID=99658 RepID=A0ABQ8HC14_9ROSI|nr:hypothetical protein JRO89_XS12G0101900 [Xanthoceras sorbifolium]